MNKSGCPKKPRRGHRRDEVLSKIDEIAAKGNDAEVRLKEDGTYAIYEIRKKAV